jgi:hypothetical protein
MTDSRWRRPGDRDRLPAVAAVGILVCLIIALGLAWQRYQGLDEETRILAASRPAPGPGPNPKPKPNPNPNPNPDPNPDPDPKPGSDTTSPPKPVEVKLTDQNGVLTADPGDLTVPFGTRVMVSNDSAQECGLWATGDSLPDFEDTAPSIDASGVTVAVIAPKKLVTIIAPMENTVLKLACKDKSEAFYLRTREG